MASTRRRAKKADQPELIIEDHPENYEGAPWITLVRYHDNKNHLVVVNYLAEEYLWGYSLEAMSVPEQQVFHVVCEEYWDSVLYNEPVRIRVSMDQWLVERELSHIFGPKITGYYVDNISRIIGPVRYSTPLPPKSKVRRRKRIDVPKELIKSSK